MPPNRATSGFLPGRSVRASKHTRGPRGVAVTVPTGIELSIGYYHVAAGFGIHVTLVPDHAVLTCTTNPPTPPHP
jgi:hypothetical protein